MAPAAAAAPCTAPVTNKVACENTQPGTPNWMVESFDDTIQGFTTDISVAPGGTVNFKINTNAIAYHVDIFRLGYYNNAGARLVTTLARNGAQTQPACLGDSTGLVDCGNWANSVNWVVPAGQVSGLYYAVLRRDDNGGENEIAFVVRDDTSTSKILFQTSDSTWQAYNSYGGQTGRSGSTVYSGQGGSSLYTGTGPGAQGSAYKVSYNRPLRGEGDENFIFNAEVPMLKFLEANGYDLSYTTDADSARRGNLIKNHQTFMAVGHDEYWSNEQRNNVEAARAAGVNMAFFTANEIFWKTRWEPSMGSATNDWRTVVCYKETKANSKIDPNPQWTGTWRDPRFSPPSDGGRPENSLLGQIFTVNGRRDDSMTVPAAYGKMRLWRNTPLATMAAGNVYTFQPGTLGYEWDTVEDNGFQPAGVAQLSRTTVNIADGQYVLKNYGDVYGTGIKTHALTYYRDQTSGSRVFAAGTVQWAWGLDDNHAFSTGTPTSDVRIKQATINLLADMGAQPATLQAGLSAASASTDTAAPTVNITNAPATSVGTSYAFSGTVSENGGGQVSGVEVSVDNGSTWHPAVWTAGTTTWNYSYVPNVSGTPTLKARAVDDSANLSVPVSNTITVVPRNCPCSIWTSAATPETTSTNDNGPVEVGVKFRAASDGYVRGIKFFKGANNTGTHTGSLWTAGGALLGTGTFVGETTNGWQTLALPTSVQVTAGTTYVASYYAPTGHYASDASYFADKSATMEPLTALQTGTDGPNGVFKFGSPGFPLQSYGDTNYWVDVVWALDPGPDTRAPVMLSTTPAAGESSVGLSAPVSVTYDETIAPGSVQFSLTYSGGTEAGTISTSGTKVTFTPSSTLDPGTTYTATMRGSDAAGNAAAVVTWTFKTGLPRPAACPCTIWDEYTHPLTPADPYDTAPVEVGTKVRFDAKGQVTGIRFYKGAGNTGTHTGSLWSSSGTRLATGTFTGESSIGWQTLNFTTPVNVLANTTYVVSYYAPNGHPAGDNGGFDQEHAYQAIHGLADGVDGGNGVYKGGAGGGFPTSTYRASNYWVDVVFQNGLNGDTTPPTITARTPAPGATNTALAGTVAATFSEPVDLGSAQFSLTDPGLATLTGTLSLSADQKTVTWTPAARLVAGTTYSASMRIADVNGNPMPAPETWSFTTNTTQTCPCTLFSGATTPTIVSSDETTSLELGVQFSSSVNGNVTAVKFYKGAGNTGTHTGSLWTSEGTLIATGTFTGETATGWQTLTFASPVAITAGQTYVASYTAPNGRYSANSYYFEQTGVSSAPLSAPATGSGVANGVYKVGPGFPTSSYRGGNYWVDVVFTPIP
jgi:methionine-rich copper-binding protein CopC